MSEHAMDGFIVARTDGSLHCVSVDREDFAMVEAAGPWSVAPGGKTFYASRNVYHGNIRSTEKLHRFVMRLGFGDKREIDHVDGNGLHNCRSNMRLATKAEQSQNRRAYPGTSRFRGVYWDVCRKRWRAMVGLNGILRHVGYFYNECDAAMAAQVARVAMLPYSVESRHPVVEGS